jgi:hypothetical protein
MLTANQVISNIMRAMYPRKPGAETPEQVILLNALRLHGLDAQVRKVISNRGKEKKAASKLDTEVLT